MEKKNQSEIYAPEQSSRSSKVVVGISGSLDSMVSAYLLKIQKYDLIAVTVVPGWGQQLPGINDLISCHQGEEQLRLIREFCEGLKIPHFQIHAKNEFIEEVVDSWTASKLTGGAPLACWNCHDLRLRLLHKKMKELGAHALATGHFAKVFRNESHGTVYVHTSNDEEGDQSALLSRLPPEILRDLLLPMSDLKKKEVKKLADNFGISALKSGVRMHGCFPDGEFGRELLAIRVAPRFLEPGELVGPGPDHQHLGEHPGLQHLSFGQLIRVHENPRMPPIGHFGELVFHTKRVVVREEEWFRRKQIMLTNCRISQESDWSEPQPGVIRWEQDKFIDCWVTPKNFGSFLLEFQNPELLLPGNILTVYKKRGKNAKVLLSGSIQYLSQRPSPRVSKGEANDAAATDPAADF
jgi:tRNA-uridine 2-sulfurtransferase